MTDTGSDGRTAPLPASQSFTCLACQEDPARAHRALLVGAASVIEHARLDHRAGWPDSIGWIVDHVIRTDLARALRTPIPADLVDEVLGRPAVVEVRAWSTGQVIRRAHARIEDNIVRNVGTTHD